MKHLATHLFVCLFLLGLSVTAFGQKLIIQYDYIKDDYAFYSESTKGIRKKIAKPVVGRNHVVKVEVVNFNPFLYRATANFDMKSTVESPQFNFASLISPIGMVGNPSSFLSDVLAPPQTRSAQVFTTAQSKADFDKVKTIYAQMKRAETLLTNLDYLGRKLDQLKNSRYMPGDTIKNTCDLIIADILEVKPDHDLSADLFNASQLLVGRNMKLKADELDMAVKRFDVYIASFKASQGKMTAVNTSEIESFMHTAQSSALKFASSLPQNTELLEQKLYYLEEVYQAIKNTPYQFNANTVAKGDEVEVEMTFFDISSDTEKEIKTKKLQVLVAGDLKVTTSVGLGFPFYNENFDYVNRDSFIVQVPGNTNTPNLAAYMNFYPYNGRTLQLGGTFGVGFPISQTSRNFNFLMGASAVIGTSNRVAIHGGATLGQVNTLDNGYEVGNKLGDAISAVPTRNTYDWGYFVGISFGIVGTGASN
jgi:hypothetical protein